jgi:hypothetical protein
MPIARFIKDGLVWGFGLWLFGYVLGIALFPLVPNSLLGWLITPIGVLVTIWVLTKKLSPSNLSYYLFLGTVWALVAIVCDYVFLVKVFNPPGGYYKLDVFVYYSLTFILPLFVGWRKNGNKTTK